MTRRSIETEDDAEEDESLIEDVSELGEDEELSDVIESDLDEEPARHGPGQVGSCTDGPASLSTRHHLEGP